MNLPFEEGVALILEAAQEKSREQAWQMWLALYPHMTEETFIPFDEFYRSLHVPHKTESIRTTAEIIDMAEAIKQRDMARGR